MIVCFEGSVYRDAFQYNGSLTNSSGEYYVPDWVIKAYNDGDLYYDSTDSEPCELFVKNDYPVPDSHVKIGDFVYINKDGLIAKSDHKLRIGA